MDQSGGNPRGTRRIRPAHLRLHHPRMPAVKRWHPRKVRANGQEDFASAIAPHRITGLCQAYQDAILAPRTLS